MSTFSKANFKSLNYNSFRPHYPASFYKILFNYVTKGNESKLPISRAIDLGCGTGVATYPLLNSTKEVIGLDLSPQMIKTANSLVAERLAQLDIKDQSRISFKTGAVEDYVYQEPKETPDGSIDLITAAQCIHWFKDYDAFFANAAKLLRPGGTLAYWFYIDPIIVDIRGSFKGDKSHALKRTMELYNKYIYDDPNFIGPHWEQPGREIIKNFSVEVNKHIPEELYEDITIKTFIPSEKQKVAGEGDLDLKKLDIPLNSYFDYLRTYSGYHNYKEQLKDKAVAHELFLSDLKEELGFDLEATKIDLVWNTGYTFITKKE
ncbi:trans-aconitate methyltransferase 2 [Scheffersomyces xylosifermentans]|uniref:trans-aconitate methyltransferase 2 n=1 Tax=Scheffersomyces xylosifermentans TaxID=1304137 RepID=UPI00315CE977